MSMKRKGDALETSPRTYRYTISHLPTNTTMSMTKKKKEELCQEIGDVFCGWLDTLRVAGYGLHTLFPEDEGYEEASTGGMSVKVLYPYKTIHLSIPRDYIDNYEAKKNNIKNSLLHEAVHVMMWHFAHLAYSRHATYQEMHDAEEHLTDHISSVVWNLTGH